MYWGTKNDFDPYEAFECLNVTSVHNNVKPWPKKYKDDFYLSHLLPIAWAGKQLFLKCFSRDGCGVMSDVLLIFSSGACLWISESLCVSSYTTRALHMVFRDMTHSFISVSGEHFFHIGFLFHRILKVTILLLSRSLSLVL